MIIKIKVYDDFSGSFKEILIDSSDIKCARERFFSDGTSAIFVKCHSGDEYISSETIDDIYNKIHYLRNYSDNRACVCSFNKKDKKYEMK